MHRVVSGLLYVSPTTKPWPQAKRKRGTKAQGLAFEKAVAKALPQAKRDQWFYFIDKHGPGHCCPDLVLDLGWTLVVLECKRTDWPESHTQVSQLYLPVLRQVQTQVLGLVVAKNLSHKSDLSLVCETLAEALDQARSGAVPTLHLPWPRSGHPSLNLSARPEAALAPLSKVA